MRWILGAVAVTAFLAGCDGDDVRGEDGGGPTANAVRDALVPEVTVTVTVRDDAGEQVAHVGYHTSTGVPSRATWASLQTADGDTWSTAYTLSQHLSDGYMEGVPEMITSDAYSGLGPDIYPLPDLDANETYRICIDFSLRHRNANGCSAPFHSD